MAKNDYPIYYSNELEDDFGKRRVRANLYHGEVPIKRKGAYAVFSNIFFYSIVVPLVWIWMRVIGGLKYEGKENLKKIKEIAKKDGKGVFIYANHAGAKDVAINYILSLPNRTVTVGYSDAESGHVLKTIVPLLGYIPLPTDVHDMPKLIDVMHFYIDKKQSIVIFPEAHLWPSYTGIRNFKRVSFRYPASFDRPIIPVFYARRKRKGLWKLLKNPRITCIIGEPIYPDPNLNVKENTQIMGDKCYEEMKRMSLSIEQEEYYHYVYRPLSEDEIINESSEQEK